MDATAAFGTVRFIDRRFERVADDSPKAGTVEVIYELHDVPDALRSVLVPARQLPGGLQKGALITVTGSAHNPTVTVEGP